MSVSSGIVYLVETFVCMIDLCECCRGLFCMLSQATRREGICVSIWDWCIEAGFVCVRPLR